MPRSLKNISLIVTIGTLLSKLAGLTRQLVLASAFGIGAAYDAYNYAYVIPGFFLILLGGINGPFHNAMITVLSKREKKEAPYIFSAIASTLGLILIILSFILFICADALIKIVGPGLTPQIHEIAVIQLQIMSPIAFLAGMIGLGFGSLNAMDEFLIPSISPLISSFVLIGSVFIFWEQESTQVNSINLALKGGVLIASATLIGALLQLIIQIPVLLKKGLARIKLNFDWNHPGVKEVWSIICPATFSSGMLQINVFTDLFFASEILGAAAGLSYANFLIQAPLGLISNALLIPLLTTFSKLTKPKSQPELISRIKQGIMLSLASMIALGAIFISLGTPIVSLVYSRGAFDQTAVNLVGILLVAYGLGMPAYLCRDLLVRVFYAIGDSKTPFHLSLIGIILNIIFDWLLVGGPSPWGNQLPFNFGAPGLVLATVGVNFFTCLTLILQLNKKLKGIPIYSLAIDSFKLLVAGIISGLGAWLMHIYVGWGDSEIQLFIEIMFSSATSILIFCLIANWLNIKEVKDLIIMFRKKVIHL